MSIQVSGAASSRFNRTTELPTSTSAFAMTFWAKRTTTFATLRWMFAIHNTGPTDGHDFIIEPSYGGQSHVPNLQVNWASQNVFADDPQPQDTWQFYAVVGSGTNLTLYYPDDTGALVSETAQQTAITFNRIWFGDGGANTGLFVGRFAHIRIWGASLNSTEVASEKASATPVRTNNLLVATSGAGADKAAALLGEVGATWIEGSGGVTVNADMPSFSSFTGPVISGEAYMPSEGSGQGEPVAGSRINRWLNSEDPSQWDSAGSSRGTITSATNPPAGWPAMRRFRSAAAATGGFAQIIDNVPAGEHVAVAVFRQVDVDAPGVCFRHMTADYGNGINAHFNLSNGQWAIAQAFGSTTDTWVQAVALGSGVYMLVVGVNGLPAGSRAIEFYPLATPGTQIIAQGKALDAGGFQFEPGRTPHYYKPAGSEIEVRVLDSIVGALSVSNIAVGGVSNFIATLLDDEAAPWDTAGAVSFEQTDGTKATLSVLSATTNWSGVAQASLTGLANGTTDVKASFGGIESTPLTLTVGGGGVSTKWVRLRCEPGWHGTSGWYVGIWEAPTAGVRFPTTKLFEATNQVFKSDPYAGTNESYMDVAVPVAVSVTVGQTVHVALENDNVNGVAVDGPAVFTALVIG